MAKRMILMLIAVAVVFGGIFGFKAFVNTQMQAYFDNAPQPPATVTSAQAETQRWSTQRKGVGTVVADQSVAISAEVSGRVTAVNFTSGGTAEEGAVLVELDAALDRAELDALQSQLTLARSEYQRTQKLFEQKRVSSAERDTALSQRDALAAQVAARNAMLAKKSIVAPFAGRLGIRQISIGQVLQPGDAIVQLSSLAPLHVDFNLPAGQALALELGMPVQVAANGQSDAVEGRLTAMEAEVDAMTRNILVRATLDNPPAGLKAGSFADVTVTLPGITEYVVVPQTAVNYQPYGNTVFLVVPPESEDGMPTAQQRFIKTGEARGDFVAVLEGLEPGDEVITSGQIKVRNGGALVIDNDNTPDAQIAPRPANS